MTALFLFHYKRQDLIYNLILYFWLVWPFLFFLETFTFGTFPEEEKLPLCYLDPNKLSQSPFQVKQCYVLNFHHHQLLALSVLPPLASSI